MSNRIPRNAIALRCVSLVDSSVHKKGEHFIADKDDKGWITEKDSTFYRFPVGNLRNENFVKIEEVITKEDLAKEDWT